MNVRYRIALSQTERAELMGLLAAGTTNRARAKLERAYPNHAKES